MNSGIYKIQNILTNDFYVGSTRNFIKRRKEHFSALGKGNSACTKLQNAVNKYGLSAFEFVPISITPVEYLSKLEQWFLDNLNPRYNVEKKACVHSGWKMSELSRAAMAKALSVPLHQYSMQGEFIKTWDSQRVASRTFGCKVKKWDLTNLTCAGYVWVQEGQELPDFEFIRNRKKYSGRAKTVYQFSKDGKLVGEHVSVRKAFAATGIDHRSIAEVANGSNYKRHSAGGFVWSYTKEVKNG